MGTPSSYLREREAYAHLAQRTIPDGPIQLCFGSVSLSEAQLQQVQQLISDSSLVVSREALLLEYIPDAVRPTMAHTTLDVAHKLFRSLYDIHAAYVLHGAIHTRSMRFVPSPDGKTATRVFWTDFTATTCASDPSLRRYDLFLELSACWDYLFGKLVRLLVSLSLLVRLNNVDVDARAAYRVLSCVQRLVRSCTSNPRVFVRPK